MDPSDKPQPPVNAAYQAEGNAVTSNPSEQRASHHQNSKLGKPVAERYPENESPEAGSWGLGRGIRGAPAGEEQYGRTEEDVGRHKELEGEQMRASGEGEVADAVNRKPGASGAEPDLASDLDRKKQEQAVAREAMKEQRRRGIVADGDIRGGVNTEQDHFF